MMRVISGRETAQLDSDTEEVTEPSVNLDVTRLKVEDTLGRMQEDIESVKKEQEKHRRDLVFGATAQNHPWFDEGEEKEPGLTRDEVLKYCNEGPIALRIPGLKLIPNLNRKKLKDALSELAPDELTSLHFDGESERFVILRVRS